MGFEEGKARDVPGSWSCHLIVLVEESWKKGKKLSLDSSFCSLTDGSRILVVLLFFPLIMVINGCCGWSLAGGRGSDGAGRLLEALSTSL